MPNDPKVYVLTVIDHFYGQIMHLEVFSEIPTFPPEETGYKLDRYHIALNAANIDGGDCSLMSWNGKEWT